MGHVGTHMHTCTQPLPKLAQVNLPTYASTPATSQHLITHLWCDTSYNRSTWTVDSPEMRFAALLHKEGVVHKRGDVQVPLAGKHLPCTGGHTCIANTSRDRSSSLPLATQNLTPHTHKHVQRNAFQAHLAEHNARGAGCTVLKYHLQSPLTFQPELRAPLKCTICASFNRFFVNVTNTLVFHIVQYNSMT